MARRRSRTQVSSRGSSRYQRHRRPGRQPKATTRRVRYSAAPTPGARKTRIEDSGRTRRSTRLEKRNRAAEKAADTRRQRTQAMPGRLQDRRSAMHKSPSRTSRRMSAGLLPARKRNEDASEKKTTTVCARNKASRRAVLIAMGYGGINHSRKYKEHKKC